MKREKILERNVIKAEQLIGTKWTSWRKSFGDKYTVEFVDKKNCIYTSNPKKYPLTYTITAGLMYISNIEGPFELRGDVLFNNELPVFERTA